MTQKLIVPLCLLLIINHSLVATTETTVPLTQYVNPFIGTAGGGNTHPGALVPWGMASGTPFTMFGPVREGEGYSKTGVVAYSEGQNFLTGFTHANLSGAGCPDLGNIVLMPTSGDFNKNPKIYGSGIEQQNAEPGYYKASLTKYGIQSELTATERTIRQRHTFPSGQANFILNLGLGTSDEQGGMVTIVSDTEIEGFDMFGQFCFEKHYNGRIFFVVRFSKAASVYGTWHDDYIQKGFHKSASGNQIGAYYSFDATDNEQIEVSIGISYVSVENARQNLEAEQAQHSFDYLRKQASLKWETALGRVQVKGGSSEDKTNFYTGLYHMLIHPNIFNDVNGEYMAMDGSVKKTEEFDRYSIFSLWDTYRNLHPFLSLVYPERQEAMVNSILEMYLETGWLPKWELSGKETFVMVGDPAAIVLTDSYLRGIDGFDTELALEAMLKSARDTLNDNWIRPGLKDYLEYGYIPHERSGINPAIKPIPWGSVSTTLEYALADWNISQFARALGESHIANEFEERSKFYKNIFHLENYFLLPKSADGQWHDKDATRPGISEAGFVEGNAWNYNFFVPHDIEGLSTLMGRDNMLNKLRQCFDGDHFVLWNEPDMAYPYLFNYFPGEEWRTQNEVHKAVKKYFHNGADGLPGNDDCGTISSWLVLSMIGLYPDQPGAPNFALSKPMFDEVVISLNKNYYSGKEIIIKKAPNNDSETTDTKPSWNSEELESYFIPHEKLVEGGVMTYK